jgi:hypothetical protein
LRKGTARAKKNDNGRLEVVARAGVTEQHRGAPFLFYLFRFSGGPRTEQAAPQPAEPGQTRPNHARLERIAETFFSSRPECSAAPVPASSPPAFHPRSQKWAQRRNLKPCLPTAIPASKFRHRGRLLGINGHSTNLHTPPFPVAQSEFRSCTELPCPAVPCPLSSRPSPANAASGPGLRRSPKKRAIHRLETTPRSPTKLLFWGRWVRQPTLPWILNTTPGPADLKR